MQQFTLSPDGKHLALNSFRQYATGSLWLIDIATNTTTPWWLIRTRSPILCGRRILAIVAFNLLPNGGSDPPFLVAKIEAGTAAARACLW